MFGENGLQSVFNRYGIALRLLAQTGNLPTVDVPIIGPAFHVT
jgi:hypothetical protein